MLQKITDLWPGLFRIIEPGRDEQDQQQDNDDDDDEIQARGLIVDEDQVLLDFKHLNWTRLMVVHQLEPDQRWMWKMGPDLIEECQAVAVL